MTACLCVCRTAQDVQKQVWVYLCMSMHVQVFLCMCRTAQGVQKQLWFKLAQLGSQSLRLGSSGQPSIMVDKSERRGQGEQAVKGFNQLACDLKAEPVRSRPSPEDVVGLYTRLADSLPLERHAELQQLRDQWLGSIRCELD